MEKLFELNYKKLGLVIVTERNRSDLAESSIYKPFIKILLVPKGSAVTIDFQTFKTTHDSLFFININQHFSVDKLGAGDSYLLYYNRDFYCIMIHDDEVACDGLLFNNIYNLQLVVLSKVEGELIHGLFEQIVEEFELQDSSQEEMIRTCLKQILLRAARSWKKQQFGKELSSQKDDVEFFRHFSRLVEIHYKTKHAVADYAELLHVAPKTITHRFKRYGIRQPNDIIKERILLEAKRLIVYTELSSKEIAYELGYDDPAYFNRLFTNKIGASPVAFRKKIRTSEY
jgi:AraC-like DNA-binding protein